MTRGPRERYEAMRARGELTPDAAQERALAQLQELADALRAWRPAGGLFGGARKPPPRGLYLVGDVGRGKSMLMDLFFETAPVRPKTRIHFHAFMRDVHADIKRWRDADDKEKRRRLKALGLSARSGDDPVPPLAKAIADRARLLCFDELQVTDVADAMILGRLFAALLDFGVVIVATSNRYPNDLYKDGLNRQLFLPFIDLIEARLDIVPLDGPTDHRLAKLKGIEVYHCPLGPEADARMQEAFRRMTGLDRGHPVDLTVLGRSVRIPEAAMGVARAGFETLCARALGPADYLAIAETFHTLLLERIPVLTPDKRNEARRFVTLIDAVYEARVKLIASAAAPPDALYPEGDGRFEFARTVSRLIEMQSEAYMGLGHGQGGGAAGNI
ncbi:MAG: AFG1 family ATPase [Alphaproteobacteria bacterium]|nr:AFG1 family ATPase [Alphaproteobacteria bacterium]